MCARYIWYDTQCAVRRTNIEYERYARMHMGYVTVKCNGFLTTLIQYTVLLVFEPTSAVVTLYSSTNQHIYSVYSFPLTSPALAQRHFSLSKTDCREIINGKLC